MTVCTDPDGARLPVLLSIAMDLAFDAGVALPKTGVAVVDRRVGLAVELERVGRDGDCLVLLEHRRKLGAALARRLFRGLQDALHRALGVQDGAFERDVHGVRVDGDLLAHDPWPRAGRFAAAQSERSFVGQVFQGRCRSRDLTVVEPRRP